MKMEECPMKMEECPMKMEECPMKMETTHVSETSTLYIHTPGNYPKEDNIPLSQCLN
jgi:hypothetical protein